MPRMDTIPMSIKKTAEEIRREREAAKVEREAAASKAAAALKSAGFLAAAVPLELGGGGAGLPEMAWAHHDLALACGSTSLAASMHSHSVVTLAWRYR